LVIAYEPVWAIGTGLNADPKEADDVHAYIRELISDSHSPEVAETLTILYGGSVNDENARDLLGMENIDGALIGGASLKPESFLRILETAESLAT
jgi:triosephosphate isomerase